MRQSRRERDRDSRTYTPGAGQEAKWPCGSVDAPTFFARLRPVTATNVIRQLKRLPARERRKVFAYVDAELERREEKADRKAVAEARRDPRPPVAWEEAKKKLGLA